MLCNMVLVLGISYITAACTVFFRDMTQIVNIVLTMGIWMTPIMWNPEATMSRKLLMIFRLNPMYYIVDGFRDSLLDKVWFWEKPVWSIYFWCFAIVVYLLGVRMFNRLKVHFSDVL
jgi:teichoic acid transport system permease protein